MVGRLSTFLVRPPWTISHSSSGASERSVERRGGSSECQGARELIACGAAKLIAQISMGGGSTIEPQRGEQLGAAKLIACVGHRAASAA
jgi:hypothetical protein